MMIDMSKDGMTVTDEELKAQMRWRCGDSLLSTEDMVRELDRQGRLDDVREAWSALGGSGDFAAETAKFIEKSCAEHGYMVFRGFVRMV